MIIDINRTDTDKEFHFKKSTDRFILVNYDACTKLFVNFDLKVAFEWGDLNYYGFYFYEDEKDDDFMGVSTDWNEDA